MDSLIPDTISYKILLDVLCFKCLVGCEVDEEEFTDLLFDLAALQSTLCTQNFLEPCSLPDWISLPS